MAWLYRSTTTKNVTSIDDLTLIFSVIEWDSKQRL